MSGSVKGSGPRSDFEVLSHWGPASRGPLQLLAAYLHGFRSVDESVILRTPNQQLDLHPWSPLKCSGWSLSEVPAVNHRTPVVERATHGQELHGDKEMSLCVWMLSSFLNGSARISCTASLNQVSTVMSAIAYYPSGAVLGNQSEMTGTIGSKDGRPETGRQVSLWAMGGPQGFPT